MSGCPSNTNQSLKSVVGFLLKAGPELAAFRKVEYQLLMTWEQESNNVERLLARYSPSWFANNLGERLHKSVQNEDLEVGDVFFLNIFGTCR